MHISWQTGAEEEMASPSPPLGAERVGVRWGIPGRRPPTSPSHACGVGPFLSPLKGGEGFLTGPARCVHALALSRGQAVHLTAASGDTFGPAGIRSAEGGNA